MDVKGEIISGDFEKLVMRLKSGSEVELGEILAIDVSNLEQGKSEIILLQVYDLVYASQISQQNLEMVSGMRLEGEDNVSVADFKLRNYKLAYLKPVLLVENNFGKVSCKTCKKLPAVFSKVRSIQKNDFAFMTKPIGALYLGALRSGAKVVDFDLFLSGEKVFSHHMLVAASTGKGKSNLMKSVLWDALDKDYVGMLVLDPHDEYYGRVGLGLKDHFESRGRLVYYTPTNPPAGARTLILKLSILRPEHFQGAISLSGPQRQLLFLYHKKFASEWILAIMQERRVEGASFHPDTVAVVKRKLVTLLGLDFENGKIVASGIFSNDFGENTVKEICLALEKGKTVIIDTSFFSGSLEIMMGSIIASEMLRLYKNYKRKGELKDKPVISVVLEEAPRVLGKKVLEQGSNIFDTLAREGRKFKVGIVAITQIPSEIPKNVLANMNTKIILGMEMNSERTALIESAAQDLREDSRTIASLDKGEAIVSSTFTRFAVPVKMPLFSDFVKQFNDEKRKNDLVSKEGEIEQGFVGIGS